MLALFALLALAGGGLWLWRTAAPADASLEAVRARGELVIGYAVEPPYAEPGPDGRPRGESVEVAAAMAARLGLRPRWVLTDFERLIPELQAGRFDVVAAGLFVTPERTERVRFTRPTLRVRPGWLVAAGGPAPPHHAQARPGPGLRIAVVAGSVEQARFSTGANAAGLLVVPDAAAGQASVLTGAADALALSLPSVRAMAARSEGRLRAVPGGDAGSALVALAVARPAAALQQALDAELLRFVGSLEHLELLARLGLAADDLPGPGDAAR